MGEITGIAWCDHTFNPWEGCDKVAPECANCYAEDRDARFHNGGHWGRGSSRLFHKEAYWREPLKWNERAKADGVRRRVFCMSLGDLMEDRRDLDDARKRVWDLIERTESLDWLILTKRPENFPVFLPADWKPHPRVWLGVSAGTQERLRRNVPWLLATPAVVRFVSAEPLLEEFNFRWASWDDWAPHPRRKFQAEPVERGGRITSGHTDHLDGLRMLDWIIVGGESGPHARPCHLEWVRTIVRQCREAKVAIFVKQMGARPESLYIHKGDYGPITHVKGGNPDEWPEDIRVRQFPEVAR